MSTEGSAPPVGGRSARQPKEPIGADEDPRSSRMGEILESALRLFAERGYVETTMADIGAAVGIRGPSLYRHVPSKQALLVEIILGSMRDLMSAHKEALAGTTGPEDQLYQAVLAHVKFQANHRLEALVSTRENRFLDRPHRTNMLRLHKQYERSFRGIIQRGCDEGIFDCEPQLASYAIIDMGISMVTWFRPDGPFSGDDIAKHYADYARKLVAST